MHDVRTTEHDAASLFGDRGLLGARRSQNASRHIACVLVVVFALCALSGLCGCKYSDVLTQHIEDPELGVLDEQADPIYEMDPDAPERPDLADISISDSDDENTQVNKLPHYDPNAPDNGPTKQRLKNPDTPHDEEASEGEQTGNPDRSGDNKDDEGEEGGENPDTSGQDEGEGENEGDGDELTSDEADDPKDSESASNGNTTVVVNPDGTTDDTATGTIAAVGEYATIAQMLGGAGALVGCDAAWLKAREADGAFDGELDRVQTAFDGDGTESGSCKVDALVKKIKPAVVLWDSSKNIPALSEKEWKKLEDAGISVQEVPHIGEMTTQDADVTAAVRFVAGVLEPAAGIGLDPVDVMTKYLEFHDGILKTCYDANGGYSYKVTDSMYDYLYQKSKASGLDNATTTRSATVFVNSLLHPAVSRASVSQNATTVDGTIRLGHDARELDISDGVGLSATTNVSGYMLLDYYLQLAGFVNNSYDTAMPESQGRPYIIMPGSTTAFGTSTKYASRHSASALFFNSGDDTVTANWHVLGNGDFPAVLTANEEIAKAIHASAVKDDGLYHMDRDYEIIVVPSGIAGSWSQGHIDSFLLAPWSFRMGDTSGENLKSAESYASEFYSKYLRCKDWSASVGDWDTSFRQSES